MIKRLFSIGYTVITIMFVLCAIGLMVFAGQELFRGINPFAEAEVQQRFSAVLEAIGLLTIAVAALELGQTIIEEEVQRQMHVSAPTRVRRFLSRFMIVIIVALSIESLVSIFNFSHEDPSMLPNAALVTVAAGVLLAAWGVFVKLNRAAEELEPEGVEEAKSEDTQVS